MLLTSACMKGSVRQNLEVLRVERLAIPKGSAASTGCASYNLIERPVVRVLDHTRPTLDEEALSRGEHER